MVLFGIICPVVMMPRASLIALNKRPTQVRKASMSSPKVTYLPAIQK